uniref:Secreted protein n=1 Tax=Seriola dumerili TaxID=41447 RepID=A0A3B4UU58_SERDU
MCTTMVVLTTIALILRQRFSNKIKPSRQDSPTRSKKKKKKEKERKSEVGFDLASPICPADALITRTGNSN